MAGLHFNHAEQGAPTMSGAEQGATIPGQLLLVEGLGLRIFESRCRGLSILDDLDAARDNVEKYKIPTRSSSRSFLLTIIVVNVDKTVVVIVWDSIVG